jgi:hypothetical protein
LITGFPAPRSLHRAGRIGGREDFGLQLVASSTKRPLLYLAPWSRGA